MAKTGGILLAGGTGSRLYPNTLVANKHLLPIYDKPMIYYSLSIFLLCEIKDITIVCNSKDLKQFKELLGNGEEFGINLNYSIQNSPDGIPDAINTAQLQSQYDKFMTVLGDNFLYGRDFFKTIKATFDKNKSNSFFYQKVKSPENFGILKWKKK
jgi:glucose-1-phosphate thymidylyltransferase